MAIEIMQGRKNRSESSKELNLKLSSSGGGAEENSSEGSRSFPPLNQETCSDTISNTIPGQSSRLTNTRSKLTIDTDLINSYSLNQSLSPGGSIFTNPSRIHPFFEKRYYQWFLVIPSFEVRNFS